MNKISSAFLIVLLAIALFSCSDDSKLSSPFVLNNSPQDSIILNSLDDKIQLRQFDAFFVELDSVKSSNRYDNVNLFRLRVNLLEAQALNRINKYQESLVVLNKIIEECSSEEKYKSIYFDAILLKGDTYFRLGNFQVAYKYLYEGKRAGLEYNSTCDMAKYDYRIGMILYMQEKYAESISYFKQSFDKYNKCVTGFQIEFRKQELVSNIGLCYYKLGMYDSAITYYNNAAQIISNISINDSIQAKYIRMALGVINGNTGKAYYARGDMANSIPRLEYNIKVNTSPNLDYQDALTSVIALAKIYLEQKNYSKFLSTISVADKYEDSAHVQKHFFEIYKLKSKYYTELGKYQEALSAITKYISTDDSLKKESEDLKNADLLISIQSLEKEYELDQLKKINAISNKYLFIAILISSLLVLGIVFFVVLLRKYRSEQKRTAKINLQVKEQSDLLLQANEEIQKNLEVLRKREIEKNRIMNMLAIDLQSPNARVISLLKQIISNPELHEEIKPVLNEIYTIILNNNDLIQEILLFSKSNPKLEQSNSYEAFTCANLINQIVDSNYFKAKQKNIELIFKNFNSDVMIYGNQEKLRRALSNLILNAIKFSHRNSKISLFITSTKETVNIHIKDEGIGIPDRMKPLLFESDPFIRRLGTEGEPTFGLGLTLVKQIVEDHKGHITFNSDKSGTEFIISLPIYKQS